MKFLICFLCFFALVLTITIFKWCGIILGGVPTMLIYIVYSSLAIRLCILWNRHKKKGDDNDKN